MVAMEGLMRQYMPLRVPLVGMDLDPRTEVAA